jgi:hypothetical protein
MCNKHYFLLLSIFHQKQRPRIDRIFDGIDGILDRINKINGIGRPTDFRPQESFAQKV